MLCSLQKKQTNIVSITRQEVRYKPIRSRQPMKKYYMTVSGRRQRAKSSPNCWIYGKTKHPKRFGDTFDGVLSRRQWKRSCRPHLKKLQQRRQFQMHRPLLQMQRKQRNRSWKKPYLPHSEEKRSLLRKLFQSKKRSPPEEAAEVSKRKLSAAFPAEDEGRHPGILQSLPRARPVTSACFRSQTSTFRRSFPMASEAPSAAN